MISKPRLLHQKLKRIKYIQEELNKSAYSPNENSGYHQADDFPSTSYNKFLNYFEAQHIDKQINQMDKQWKKVLMQMLTHPHISEDQEMRALQSTCPWISSVAKTVLTAKKTTNINKEEKQESREDLDKVYYANNKAYPEKSDVGKPHPTDQDKVGHQLQGETKKPVWSHPPELVEHHKKEILKNFNNFNLSHEGKKKMVGLMTHLWDDPDAGVMTSGTTQGSRGDFSELRVRHLHNASKNRFGYKIKEQNNGDLQIHAPRHSKGDSHVITKTVWNWDGKTLKSEHKDPIGNIIGQGEYSYGKE